MSLWAPSWTMKIGFDKIVFMGLMGLMGPMGHLDRFAKRGDCSE